MKRRPTQDQSRMLKTFSVTSHLDREIFNWVYAQLERCKGNSTIPLSTFILFKLNNRRQIQYNDLVAVPNSSSFRLFDLFSSFTWKDSALPDRRCNRLIGYKS